jgi:hypothetical protein
MSVEIKMNAETQRRRGRREENSVSELLGALRGFASTVLAVHSLQVAA